MLQDSCRVDATRRHEPQLRNLPYRGRDPGS
jgi:hypothetical protein